MGGITYPWWGLSQSMLLKGVTGQQNDIKNIDNQRNSPGTCLIFVLNIVLSVASANSASAMNFKFGLVEVLSDENEQHERQYVDDIVKRVCLNWIFAFWLIFHQRVLFAGGWVDGFDEVIAKIMNVLCTFMKSVAMLTEMVAVHV